MHWYLTNYLIEEVFAAMRDYCLLKNGMLVSLYQICIHSPPCRKTQRPPVGGRGELQFEFLTDENIHLNDVLP